MINLIIVISLVCVGIHVCLWDGMIFGFVATSYDRVATLIIRKGRKYPLLFFVGKLLIFLRNPLFGCLSCMGSLWTIIMWFTLSIPISIKILLVMLAVCGLNTIIKAIIKNITPDEES